MADREKRDRAFALMRARNTRRDAALTPTERVALADAMLEGLPVVESKAHPTDEPMALWREIREKLRGIA